MGAWSVHTLDDGSTCEGGAACLLGAWPDLGHAVSAHDPDRTRPVFVTVLRTTWVFGPGMDVIPLPTQEGLPVFATIFAEGDADDRDALALVVTRDSDGDDVPLTLELYHCPEGLDLVESIGFITAPTGDPDAGINDGYLSDVPELTLSRSDDAICTITLDVPAWSVVAARWQR